MHSFRQVDVFGSGQMTGNPVAVVHDADDLDPETMQRFAQWTNLSETTFLLTPRHALADYRIRIFTPTQELSFAGHPTLGSAHAWLEAGGAPKGSAIVQDCDAGLVTIARRDHLEFEAPPLRRHGALSDDELEHVTRALRIPREAVVDSTWADNGAGWAALLLEDAHAVLALRPDSSAFDGWDIGVVGPWTDGGSDADVEVRAFAPDDRIPEDPVTGSLNAALGQWLGGNRLPETYVAAQGTAIGRRGRVSVRREGDQVWVGGQTVTVLRGQSAF